MKMSQKNKFKYIQISNWKKEKGIFLVMREKNKLRVMMRYGHIAVSLNKIFSVMK